MLAFGLAAALVAALLLPVSAVAQGPDRRVPLRPQWEWRAEGVAASAPSAVLGAGLNVRAGWYLRLGAALAGGAVRTASDEWEPLARLDVTTRFLLDPFGERARGLYGGAGLSVAHRSGGDGLQDPVLLMLVGLEGPRTARGAWAVELGLGGGVRLAIVRRGARADRTR